MLEPKTVIEQSTSVYSKLRLRAEWNWNRFVNAYELPGQPVMYRGPFDADEHPLYVDQSWNVVPTDRWTGKPMVDSEGYIVDRYGNRRQYYSAAGNDSPNRFVKLSEVRIAIAADETSVTDENGNDILVAPDATILDTDGDGVPYTAVDSGEVYVLGKGDSNGENRQFLISKITGDRVKVADVLAVRDAKRPVTVSHLPQYAPGSGSGTFPEDSMLTGDYDEDPEFFPLESIVEAERPDKRGDLKVWASKGAGGSMGSLVAQSGDSDSPGRYYLASVDSKYKYWTNSQDSGTKKQSVNGPAGYDVPGIGPIVNYKLPVRMNKIVIGVDKTLADGVSVPTWSDVRIEVDNGDGTTQWYTAARNPTVNDDGKIVLYCNGNYGTGDSQGNVIPPGTAPGASTHDALWVDANNPEDWPEDWNGPNLDNELRVISIQFRVWRLSKPGVRLALTEISGRLEKDLSDDVIEQSNTFEMSDHSFVAPFGTASSNVASVTLSNLDGRYSNNNKFLIGSTEPNLYYGIIDKHVKFAMDIAVDNSPIDEVGEDQWLRQFTMRAEEWSSDKGTATVSLKDDSLILQEIKPNKMLLQSAARKSNRAVDLSAKEIIAQLLDSIGYTNYHFDTDDIDRSIPVTFWWADAEQTVWDYISEIAQSTQIAVYFDRYGILQFMPLRTMYTKRNPAAVITTEDLTYDDGITMLSNAIDVQRDRQYEANVVNLTYHRTSLSDTNSVGVPQMESVWEPEGTTVLRASGLGASLNSNAHNSPGADYSIKINANDARSWPFSGMVSVDGELITYNAKKYWYYDKKGKRVFKYITSNDEKSALDKQNPKFAYRNAYDGRLRISERGVWESNRRAHYVDVNGYTYRLHNAKRPVTVWTKGVKQDKSNSIIRMATNSNAHAKNTTYTISRGTTLGEMPKFYGTRLRFPTSGYRDGAAGVAFSLGTNESGIYVKLSRTKLVSREKRQFGHELTINTINRDGYTKSIASKGIPLDIAASTWYDLDVAIFPVYEVGGSVVNYRVHAMVNGVSRLIAEYPVSSFNNDLGNFKSGRFGLFVQGYTACDFEYLYAYSDPIADTLDESGFFDRIKGGYSSTQGDREITFDTKRKSRVVKKKNSRKTTRQVYNYRYNTEFFDDFGPIVHEVRPFDVKFNSDTPVVSSNLYFSNDYQVMCPEYAGTPFGAKFLMVNVARENAVLSGEDTLTFGPDNSITQAMLIYGRKINIDDTSTLTVRDDGAVARRGEVALDIDAKWIQTDTAARKLASYVLAAWGTPMDSLQVEMFGDPRMDIGDIVSVYAPDEGIGKSSDTAVSTVKSLNTYIVNSVTHNYSSGLTTALELRSLRKNDYELSDYEELLAANKNNMIYNSRFEIDENSNDWPDFWQFKSNLSMTWKKGSAIAKSDSVNSVLIRGKIPFPSDTSKISATQSYIVPPRYDTVTGQRVDGNFPHSVGDYFHAEVRVKANYHAFVGLRMYGYGTSKSGEIAMEKVELQAGESKTIKIDGQFTDAGYTSMLPLVYFYNSSGRWGASTKHSFVVDMMYFRSDPVKQNTLPG